jgi:predicted O-methyltransferase YrrM
MIIKRLSLIVRRNLPDRVRHMLRLGRHVVARGRTSDRLPKGLLADCRMCASRFDLVEALPRGGSVAEVGSYKGEFARHILATCNPADLHLIDLDFSVLDPAVAQDDRVRLHQGFSHEVLASFPDQHFDWIYIDADHSYAGAIRDANAAAAKVKPGGFLVFNDFAHMDPFLGAYGVHRAVVDFALDRRWPFAWFAYDPMALYDVALRRPAA